MTTRAAAHRRNGRRVTRFADDDFVQTRYNLRAADERHGTRDEDDYDYEYGRRKATRPAPRVGQRRARSPSPVNARTSRRRETGDTTKRATAMTRHRPVEDYVTHPLDDFDRYMLARRERSARPREHMRPAAREMERLAYVDGRRRRGRSASPQEEDEAEGEGQFYEYIYSADLSEEEDVDYDRFRAQRQLYRSERDRDEGRRGRQMTRRSDMVQRGDERDRRYEGEEEEEEEGEGYEYDDSALEVQGESDEDEYDEEDLLEAISRAYTGPTSQQQRQQQRQPKRRRRDEEEQEGYEVEEVENRRLAYTVGNEEEEQRRPTGRRRTRNQEAEEEEEAVPQRRQGRKLPARKTHRHPTYEEMIAEALVKVGKNGKASGVAIFKYVHDHFDMPANDRLVRNHLHQAFERLIDSGQLRHKKASYVLPRNLLAQYDAKYGGKKDEEETKEEGEKRPAEAKAQGDDQAAQEGVAQEKQAQEGEEAPSAEKDASAGQQQHQQQEKTTEEKADKSEETQTTPAKKGASGRKRSRHTTFAI